MNGPNKQEDLKIFLQQQEVGVMGFLEAKVKMQNVAHVMNKVCSNWQWIHNATQVEKGRVTVGWHPQ